MKKVISIILIISFNLTVIAQTMVSVESSPKISDSVLIPVNRIEVKNSNFRTCYDYKSTGEDVFGISATKRMARDKFILNLGLLEIGDWNDASRFITTVSGKFQTEKWKVSSNWSHFFPADTKSGREQITARFESRLITAEGMLVVADGFQSYGWISFHPDKFYAALGHETSKTWVVLGTKDCGNIGELAFFDYDKKTGNFWLKSQTGIGDINQAFFCQENYDVAASYFVIPSFFYLHFSPLSTKGIRTVKVEAARTNGVYTSEISYGRQIGKIFQAAVGMISNIKDGRFKAAPMVEVYKDWQLADFKAVIELRYDFLAKQVLGYTTIRYAL